MPVQRTGPGSIWRRVLAGRASTLAERAERRARSDDGLPLAHETHLPRHAHLPSANIDERGNALSVRRDAGVLVPSPSAIFRGPLFAGVPSPRDVEQGKLGDCYLLSSLAAIAAVHPEWIHDAVSLVDPLRPDGDVAVRFFDERTGARQVVVVDRKLPIRVSGTRRRKGWPRYARGRPPDDPTRMLAWGPLVEKAYAAWKGGYPAMGHGGSPARALFELTGRESRVLPCSAGPRAIGKALLDAWQAGLPIVASSLKKARAADLMGTGVRANHAYAVLGVREEHGDVFVTVRNPWGHYEPGSLDKDDPRFDGEDDGIFELRLDDFVRYFRKITTLEND